MTKWTKITLGAVLVSVPAFVCLFPFGCGFFALPQMDTLLVVPFMLLGPLIATAIAARLLKTGALKGAAVGGSLYVATVAGFVLAGAGAARWTDGLALNFRIFKNPRHVQEWAILALARYENGELITSKSKGEWWVVGTQSLAEKEIPPDIGHLWHARPAIGIAAMKGPWLVPDTNALAAIPASEVSAQIHCVAFSWEMAGLLVGPPDFTPTWKAWYIRQIIPGVYAYSMAR